MSLDLSTPGKDVLRRLLSERNQYPERSERIDAEIRRQFERTVAFLCLDMSGFSRLTAKHGIIHFLAMIEQMEAAARPAVEDNGGHVLRQEADNLFAVFKRADDALDAALDIFRAFRALNEVLPDDRDIYGCIGIGYGPTLIIGKHDAFGHEVNFACKLGEDLAKREEILLTGSAHQALTGNRSLFEPVTFELGDLKLAAHRYSGAIEETL